MKIQCPNCNKIILVSQDVIIPKVGLCPNCGIEVNFTASSEMFPNNKYDKDGKLVYTNDDVQRNFQKLGEDLNSMIKELQDSMKGDN